MGMSRIKEVLLVCFLAATALLNLNVSAAQYHVSVNGADRNEGLQSKPFKTIMAAAQIAQPGDTITVHEGTYRERINPPRGGESDSKRITYRAAEGEKVVVKGSEVVTGWLQVGDGVWKVSIPNTLFGNYNPYTDVIGIDWYRDMGRAHHTGEVYLNNKSLYEVATIDAVKNPRRLPRTTDPEGSLYVWHCSVDEDTTTLHANFHDFDPNKELVEINVRQTCFYPGQPGRNYITIRGLRMSQAACQWSTATDEQNGLIGTHWSKGWIIENNVITHSKNIGIALGKDRKSGHRAWSKERSKPGYLVYNEVILRALLESGWNKDNVGSHIVRNNTIYDCEKNGIHGSLGAVFCRIENNHIYNIYTKRQYHGADIGGIKILGAIDVLIKNNRIHNTHLGLWMDWMAQGTRITGNLLYDNDNFDLFIEVNHGPFVIDNNLLLSGQSLLDRSQGGAYIHNLFTGKINTAPVRKRATPYHKAHSTMIAGYEKTFGGDDRFYNNIFVGDGLKMYDKVELAMYVNGNVYMKGSQPYGKEKTFARCRGFDPQIKVIDKGEHVFLNISIDPSLKGLQNTMITTEHLGKARIPDLPFEEIDGSFLKIDKDYLGIGRDAKNPTAGPLEAVKAGAQSIKVW